MRHGYRPGARLFERGGIKFAILEMLKDKPRHGYDIIREMEEQSGGFYSPSPGAVYPTLQALEDQDLVTSTPKGARRSTRSPRPVSPTWRSTRSGQEPSRTLGGPLGPRPAG